VPRIDRASAKAGMLKDAATMIVVDRSWPEPRVLLGKRHSRHVFMPGRFVFPGGSVDASDGAMSIATPLDAQIEAS
jgi:8-oxo-dGTP pyrophosphatase MutT (NUDIX family)